MDNRRTWAMVGGYRTESKTRLNIHRTNQKRKPRLTANQVMAPWIQRALKADNLYGCSLPLKTGLALLHLGQSMGAVV
jgi:hypothetical protein